MLNFRPSKLAFALFPLLLPCAAAVAQRSFVNKALPALVTNGTAQKLSAVTTDTTLHLVLNLPLRNQAQLDALLSDLYNPQSPNFHHWLQPQEFDARFGPLRADTQTVSDWAKSKGFTVTSLSTNGRIVEVDAPVEAVNAAFHVTETTFHDTVKGRNFFAPDREPATTDLSVTLLGVDGLDDSSPMFNHLKKDPNAGIPALIASPGRGIATNGLLSEPVSGGLPGGGISSVQRTAPRPSVSGSGPSSSYLPSDMRAAYYGSGPLTGQGITVAIFSFDGYLTSDVSLYYANTGMTSSIPLSNVLVSGYAGICYSSNNGTSGTCDDGEQILDIVQVQGMAPGLAGILFYEGTSANPILNQMVTDNKAKIITSSWGGGGFGTSSDTYFQQMATQGQSYFNATGDDGAFNKYTYGAPSLDPYITQVGGTDLVTTGPGGAWSSETAWADSGGGYWISGISTTAKYTIPTWQSQTGVATTANAASKTYRNVPDMAAEANFDNPTADNGVFEIGYGGTSYATPRLAGYVALAAEQYAKNNGGAFPGFGAINPTLYTAGLSTTAATVYHDITSGTNPAYEGTTVYTSVAGYDLVTGWGSPNGTGLINLLGGSPAADFSIAANPISVVTGGNTSSDPVTVTAINSFTGTVALTATGLPTGVTAAYTSGTSTTPGALAFTTDTTATMGTYTVTVTGTSGTLSHTISVPLTVEKRANGDYALSATSVSVNQGVTGTSTITATPAGGIAGGLFFAVSGLPPGVTASLSASQVTYLGTAAAPASVTVTFSVPASTTAGSYSVTVTGTSYGNIVHTVTVPLTVTVPPSLLVNGGFETGAFAPWTATTVSGAAAAALLTASSGIPPHTGNYFALLEGGSAAGTDTLTQQVTIPAGGTTATVGVWYWLLTGQTGTTAVDVMTFQITDTSGNVLKTLGTLSNLNAGGYWAYVGYDASAYIGQTVVLKITAAQAGTTYTDFLLDDVSLVTY